MRCLFEASTQGCSLHSLTPGYYPCTLRGAGGEPMKSATRYFLAMTLGATLSAGLLAQGIQYDKIEIKTEKVAPNLYMLSGSEGVDPGHPDGAGGRIGVLARPDGVFMVDAQYLQIGDKGLAAVRGTDPGSIRVPLHTPNPSHHTRRQAPFSKSRAAAPRRDEL